MSDILKTRTTGPHTRTNKKRYRRMQDNVWEKTRTKWSTKTTKSNTVVTKHVTTSIRHPWSPAHSVYNKVYKLSFHILLLFLWSTGKPGVKAVILYSVRSCVVVTDSFSRVSLCREPFHQRAFNNKKKILAWKDQSTGTTTHFVILRKVRTSSSMLGRRPIDLLRPTTTQQ